MRIGLSVPVILGLLTATVAACDNRQLTGPNVRSPSFTVSEPVGLGSGFLQAPPTSSPSDLTNLPYEEVGIAVPESTWVVVRVSGSLGMRWNTEGCATQPPFWQCADNPPFIPYGPDPGTQGGPVQLFKADGSFTAIGLRGSGESAIGIFYQNRPGPLVGHLNLSPVYAWNPINGGNTPSWFLSGGYTVSATAVPAPFTVTESTADADGVVTYTAEPLDGLQFSNPPPYGYFPPGKIAWAFYPGDSLPDRPDRTWPGWGVPQCELSPVCRYKPSVPGRMQVTAFVEWRSATTRSKPAPLCASNQNRSVRASASGSSGCTPQPTLAVECTPADTVLALDPVRCQAVVDPSSAALTVSSWQFVGDSLGVKLSQTGDSIAWTFRPMVCGTVTVAGLVDGVPQSASRHIDVECNMLQKIPADATDSMLLNNRAVQRAMRQYWNASNPNGPTPREQGGYIVRDSTGALSVVPMSGNSKPNVCFAYPNGADLSPLFAQGYQVLGMFHTHPHQQGATPPPNCHAQGAHLPGATFGDGPSQRDYDVVNMDAWKMASYIVDFGHVHPYKPGQKFTTNPPTEPRSANCN